MKKIHITEAQLECLKKKLSEVTNIDLTKQTEENNGNVKMAWDKEKTANPQVAQMAASGEASVTVNPEGIDECGGGCITKRQIKEAKIKKLQENSTVYTKKDLR